MQRVKKEDGKYSRKKAFSKKRFLNSVNKIHIIIVKWNQIIIVIIVVYKRIWMMLKAMQYDSNDFSSMVLSTVKSSIFYKPNNINYILSNNDDIRRYLYEDNNNNASMTTILDYQQYVNANFSSTERNVSNNINSEVHGDSNYWALLALILVFGTACGNILVCLAIYYEKRLQNVTNYFLASLALTDLMVAVLVMPLGILTLYRGK